MMIKRLLLLGALALCVCKADTGVKIVDDFSALNPQLFDNAHANVTGTVVNINTTGTVLKGLVVLNTTAAACYLQLFNATASNVTLGTTAPTITIPFGANANPVILPASGQLFQFGTALSVAATTTQTNSTGCAMSVTAFYSVKPVQP
jgi:hypothetical protein